MEFYDFSDDSTEWLFMGSDEEMATTPKSEYSFTETDQERAMVIEEGQRYQVVFTEPVTDLKSILKQAAVKKKEMTTGQLGHGSAGHASAGSILSRHQYVKTKVGLFACCQVVCQVQVVNSHLSAGS